MSPELRSRRPPPANRLPSPLEPGARARSRRRPIVWTAIALCGAVGAAALAATLAWPRGRLVASAAALARVEAPAFGARVSELRATGPGGAPVAVSVDAAGRVRPARLLPMGERVTIELTVRRPGWISWLVGAEQHASLVVRTPTARVTGRWLAVAPGRQVRVATDRPVRVVQIGGRPPRVLPYPSARLPLGVVASGAHRAGSVQVRVAARAWERPGPAVRVAWFPAGPAPTALVSPAPGGRLAPLQPIRLTFSQPVRAVLGSRRPTLAPAVPGRWRATDAHTLVFTPAGLGYGLGAHVRLELHAGVRAPAAGKAARASLAWDVPAPSILRLQQLLAEEGYLPVTFSPSADPPPRAVAAELAAAVDPPAGRFRWRYPHTPASLRRLWRPGADTVVTRGAVMAYEHDHGLAVDGIPGPRVWRALLADALAGKRHAGGYSYVYVHSRVPQSLNLWHDGRVILSSPGNTGIPAAPTQLGTYPVFEHIPVGTMSGTNPDGSHYDDPGIRWISYFHGGDAIHAFDRASYGTPQSLGCVELPLAAAAKVWPYTPIGTLVTVLD